MNNSLIANRYAKAYFKVGLEQNLIDIFAEDIKFIEEVYNSQPDFKWIIENPVFMISQKINVFNKIFNNQIHELTFNFLKILTEKGRDAFLSDVIRAFKKLYSKHSNIEVVNITSAGKISEEFIEKITKILKEQTGKNIELNTNENARLIGGFTLMVNDQFFDASVSGKLNRIRKELLN